TNNPTPTEAIMTVKSVTIPLTLPETTINPTPTPATISPQPTGNTTPNPQVSGTPTTAAVTATPTATTTPDATASPLPTATGMIAVSPTTIPTTSLAITATPEASSSATPTPKTTAEPTASPTQGAAAGMVQSSPTPIPTAKPAALKQIAVVKDITKAVNKNIDILGKSINAPVVNIVRIGNIDYYSQHKFNRDETNSLLSFSIVTVILGLLLIEPEWLLRLEEKSKGIFDSIQNEGVFRIIDRIL
ncbi:MAG TPA: hypothetical protein VF828_04815, partial [Patescibacteria group bacterium]